MGIERLREPCPKWAANEIDHLRADNKKLREALEGLMRAETNQQFAAAGQKARAELASRQIDIDTFREGNQKLRAELAALEKRCIDGEKVILRCNKKITEVEIWNKEYRDQLAEARRALLASNDIVLANKKLQEDNAAKDGIIANLNERSAQYERELAEAHAGANILVADVKRFRDRQLAAEARAERAEAELVDVQVFNHELDDKLKAAESERALHIEAYNAMLARAERAEAERDAMREALEGMIAVVEGRFDGNPHADIDALAKARAARDHSQGEEG